MALLDGYSVGDRLLEGVMFECRKNDDGTFDVKVSPECAPYFSNLNEAKWLAAMKEYAEETDIFTCPNCRSDVVPEDQL